MKRTAIRTVAAIACSAAALTSFAACGSDSEDDAKASTLTAEEFKTQANQVCKDGNVELQKVFGGLATATSQEDADTIAREGAALIKKQAADIEALAEPAELSDQVTAMIAAIGTGVTAIEDQGVAVLSQDSTVFDDANAKAKALGLEDCGAE
ncbi:MAG: hypothetical protein NTV23_00710 [Propionibacteriales bacterium]|nr:hypothetical protein [Propionibacteriales bacterium]